MASATSTIVSPYSLAPEELVKVVQACLDVLCEQAQELALNIKKDFLNGEFSLNKQSDTITLALVNLNTYKLCPKMLARIPKSLVEAMLESKDVKDHTKPGERLNPAALIKQLKFWLDKGYHLHHHWSDVSEFPQTVIPLFGEAGSVEEMIQEIFRETFKEASAASADASEESSDEEKENPFVNLKLTVKLQNENGVITPSLRIAYRPSGWTIVDPAEERVVKRETQHKPAHKPAYTLKTSGGGGGKAAPKPSIAQLTSGESAAAVAPTPASVVLKQKSKPAASAKGTWKEGAPKFPSTPAEAPVPPATPASKPAPVPAVNAGAGGGAAPNAPLKAADAAKGSPLVTPTQLAGLFNETVKPVRAPPGLERALPAPAPLGASISAGTAIVASVLEASGAGSAAPTLEDIFAITAAIEPKLAELIPTESIRQHLAVEIAEKGLAALAAAPTSNPVAKIGGVAMSVLKAYTAALPTAATMSLAMTIGKTAAATLSSL